MFKIKIIYKTVLRLKMFVFNFQLDVLKAT